ncbi:SAM-dependent methyltransferase [Neorhizobium sp. SOG26]|nr:SAM-dependent methyltransferase [Neorhizobium sp. SOG26]
MRNFLRRRAPSSEFESSFDQYVTSTPHHQNAIEALAGWNSAFPASLDLKAGPHHLYADPRIEWAISQYGEIEDKKILEVGPLEGMHTFMLNKWRPKLIDAIEANRICYLRCLVTKQILDLDRATFYLGDAQRWLETPRDPYDLTVASGVLYHLADPGGFLRRVSEQTRSLYIWTHYFDDVAMPDSDIRRTPFTGKIETRSVNGYNVRYYERSYQHANESRSFCGGIRDRHYWMHKEDIVGLLQWLGFEHVIIHDDEPAHSGGPCFSIFARARSE